jgi:hypothetical protein
VPEYFRLPNVNLFFDVLSFADPLVFLAH